MEESTFNMVEELSELRKRILITVGIFLLFFIGAFVFVRDIYEWLVKDLPVPLAVLGPSEILWVYVMLASVAAITAVIPVAAYQVWRFVSPALTEKERKVSITYIPALFLLFIGGISFGYFVLFPIVLQFLMSLSDDLFTTFFTTEKYFRFLMQMTLPFGFLFELPLVIMFLTSLGILNPERLRKSRKYAYFGLVVVSVLITPPDFLSDVLVIIPLFFLFECSLLLSNVIYKRKQAAEAKRSGPEGMSA
ncbi:twin-arginine translocase subunit TatC [Alteribacillus iranensis]|uniref:Sec-independent protein translocase protein TatC n=1 Tax=Alteribacillus iranensis TaxID=930128 RepID=A0A1I2BXA5_9BACI|nr:twin-arginine translocase subunit TatC [Alteribacillus iranensis]SFE60528.1 sec-independent protein translocase protein TatC [Alteribacillus iranensis]